MDIVVPLYILAVLVFLYPLVYYFKLRSNRYMFYVSVLVVLATVFHMFSYYGLMSNNIGIYDVSEFIANLFILFTAIVLFKNLHGLVYENKLSVTASIVPLPILLFTQGGGLFLSATPSFVLFGMIFVLNVLSLYYSYLLYRARSRGSMYWLILFMFILILTITTTVYMVIEVMEFIGLEEFIETYEVTLNIVKATLYIIIGLTMAYSSYYHNKKVLPLIKELEEL